jgi:hypothetical protein
MDGNPRWLVHEGGGLNEILVTSSFMASQWQLVICVRVARGVGSLAGKQGVSGGRW